MDMMTPQYVMMNEVVNDVTVYGFSVDEYAEYKKALEEYEYELGLYEEGGEDAPEDERPELPDPPEIDNPLYGLRILDVNVTEQTKMTSSPVETGVEIVDYKVRQPVVVTIKGICDNLRGEATTDADTRYGAEGTASAGFSNAMGSIPLVGGVINNVVGGIVDSVMGYEFRRSVDILSRARTVYGNIHKMLKETDVLEGGAPKTYIISTKGAVYSNMVLESVDQLNDAEHLMVVPVTLKFKELMIVGASADGDNAIPSDDQDAPLLMGGYMKKNSWLENIKEFDYTFGIGGEGSSAPFNG